MGIFKVETSALCIFGGGRKYADARMAQRIELMKSLLGCQIDGNKI